MSLSFNKIDKLRVRILRNLKDLELNKYHIKSHDLTQLRNHHNFILSTLDNMVNIQKVEKSDPWNNIQSINDICNEVEVGNNNKTVIYNPDGTTRIVSNTNISKTNGDWEHQFDPSIHMNPPCYIMPPQNLTSINKINNSGEHDIMNGL